MLNSSELLFLGLLLTVTTIQLSWSVSVNVVHDDVPDSLLDQYDDQYDDDDGGMTWPQKDQIKMSFDALKDKAKKLNTPVHLKLPSTTTNKMHSDSSSINIKDEGKEKKQQQQQKESSNNGEKYLPAKKSTTQKTSGKSTKESNEKLEKNLMDDDHYADNVSKLSNKKINKKNKNNTTTEAKKLSTETKKTTKLESKAIEILRNAGVLPNPIEHKNTESNHIEVKYGEHNNNEEAEEDEDEYDDEDEEEDEDEDDEDDDDEEDDEEDDEDNGDEDEEDERNDFGHDNDIEEDDVLFSQDIPCPRYCVCERNINNYLVAYCSRIDSGTQKFGKDITDLVVTDVSPKYPILLGPHFFTDLGLKHISSIKLSNCSIEYLHPDAFRGLDDLYSVNLTNVGLALINPDTFAENKKLRLLTIMGNDLSVMYNLHYIIKSSSIEELNLARNNLQELNPHAFSKLTNVFYINLSQNNLQNIPENVFERLETLEELDLSYNSLKSLPSNLFINTSVAILNLKGNSISNDLRFGGRLLQRLDLSFNQIHAIHYGMFDKMTELINLNLKGNDLATIQIDSFIGLKNLRYLDLSINKLEQISSMLFYKNGQLEVVHLDDNPRLSQLPTDGFISHNGYFRIYYLDISNCAIGALGHKTFRTMPHLTTLKLAWNNINNLDRDTFASVTRLIDLDLSNNLIKKLDNDIFRNNNDLAKLNLAGNPLGQLSARLFKPFRRLRELDVSDCDLGQLLMDNHISKNYAFFDTLRSFNASFNQILRISSNDIRNFKHLRSLDVSQNPLICNAGFQDFIRYVSLNSQIFPHKMPSLERLIEENSESMSIQLRAQSGWSSLAHEVCKHEDNMNMMKQTNNRYAIKYDDEPNMQEEILDDMNTYKQKHKKVQHTQNKDMELDSTTEDRSMMTERVKKTQNILEVENKADKTHQKKPIVVKDDELDSDYDDDDNDDDSETDETEGDETEGENGENAEEDEDEDEDNENEDDDIDEQAQNIEEYVKMLRQRQEAAKKMKATHGQRGPLENNISNENKDKSSLDKVLSDRAHNYQRVLEESMKTHFWEDRVHKPEDEDLIIEQEHFYYSSYRFLGPIVITLISILILLVFVAKIVLVIMYKRGERYRMSLLQAHKNTIVYQKLSEEIQPTKESKLQFTHPKVHRYAPISSV